MPLCCGDAWRQVLCDGPLFPSSGVSSLFVVMVSDRSILRSLWSRRFPSTYILYLLFDMCDDLVVTGGMVSRGQGLTLAPLVRSCCRSTCYDCRAFIIFLFSLCFSLHGCCLSGSTRAFGISRSLDCQFIMSLSCFTASVIFAGRINVMGSA